jgi:HK97 family phage portal protein
LAAKRFSNYFWENGAAPGLVVKVPSVLTQEAADRLKTNMQEFKKDKSGRTLPLEGGSEVETTGIPQRDAQFLETMNFNKTQIASLFRVPPPLIGDLTQANYSNVQELYMQFVKSTMAPWWNRWEHELNRKLNPATESGRNRFFRFNADGLLRGDATTRAEYYQTLRRIGAITPNEIREQENMNRSDQEGADQLHKQLQDVPLGTPPQ